MTENSHSIPFFNQNEFNTIIRNALMLSNLATNADESSYLEYDQVNDELEFVLTVGNDATEKKLKGQRVPLGAGIVGLAAKTLNVEYGRPSYNKVEQANEPSWVIACPIERDGQLVGMITSVSFNEDKEFDEFHGQLMENASVLISSLIKMKNYAIYETNDVDSTDRKFIEIVEQIAAMNEQQKASYVTILSTMLKVTNGN